MADKSSERVRDLYCPSAAALDDEDTLVFGVVVGSPEAPEVAYLDAPTPLTPELRALAEDVDPAEIFRTTSRCVESHCHYFGEGRCRLASHLVATLPTVTSELPPCSIRAHCRWFAEERAAACMRCPQVITQSPKAAHVGHLEPHKRRLPVF